MAVVDPYEATLFKFSRNELFCSYIHYDFVITYKGQQLARIKELISIIENIPILLSEFIKLPNANEVKILEMQDRIVDVLIYLAPPKIINESFFIDINQFLSDIRNLGSNFEGTPEGQQIVITMQNIGDHALIVDKISLFLYKLNIILFVLKIVEPYHNCFYLRPEPSQEVFDQYTHKLCESLTTWPSQFDEGFLVSTFLNNYHSNTAPLIDDSTLRGLDLDDLFDNIFDDSATGGLSLNDISNDDNPDQLICDEFLEENSQN